MISLTYAIIIYFLQYNIYWQAINLNKSIEDIAENDKIKFTDFIDFILNHESTCNNMIKTIESVEMKKYFAVNNISGLLHMHLYIHIMIIYPQIFLTFSR